MNNFLEMYYQREIVECDFLEQQARMDFNFKIEQIAQLDATILKNLLQILLIYPRIDDKLAYKLASMKYDDFSNTEWQDILYTLSTLEDSKTFG